MINEKIEGYWYSELSSEYPMPVKDVLTEQEAIKIYGLIKLKEEEARLIRYKGPTRSRITGEYLGSREYATLEWRWPADFAKHYVLENRVKPTDEFLDYIGYKHTKNK